LSPDIIVVVMRHTQTPFNGFPGELYFFHLFWSCASYLLRSKCNKCIDLLWVLGSGPLQEFG